MRSSLLSVVVDAVRADAEAAEEKFNTIVAAIAADDPTNIPSPADVREVLRLAGRSVADLQAAVSAMHRRRDLLATVADGEAAETEQQRIAAEVAAENAAFAELHSRHNDRLAALGGAFDDRLALERRVTAGKVAARELAAM